MTYAASALCKQGSGARVPNCGSGMSEQTSLKFCKPYFARDQWGSSGEAVPAALQLVTRDRSTTMSTLADTRTPQHPASHNPVDARELTIDEVIPHLVGRTIDEVERELILRTLIHCCGSPNAVCQYSRNFNPVHAQQDSRIRGSRNFCSRTRRASCRATERFQNCNAVTPPLIFVSRQKPWCSNPYLSKKYRRASGRRADLPVCPLLVLRGISRAHLDALEIR